MALAMATRCIRRRTGVAHALVRPRAQTDFVKGMQGKLMSVSDWAARSHHGQHHVLHHAQVRDEV